MRSCLIKETDIVGSLATEYAMAGDNTVAPYRIRRLRKGWSGAEWVRYIADYVYDAPVGYATLQDLLTDTGMKDLKVKWHPLRPGPRGFKVKEIPNEIQRLIAALERKYPKNSLPGTQLGRCLSSKEHGGAHWQVGAGQLSYPLEFFTDVTLEGALKKAIKGFGKSPQILFTMKGQS